jgi:hypothetical protein
MEINQIELKMIDDKYHLFIYSYDIGLVFLLGLFQKFAEINNICIDEYVCSVDANKNELDICFENQDDTKKLYDFIESSFITQKINPEFEHDIASEFMEILKYYH